MKWKKNIGTFDSEDRVKLLSIIDSLRELGISDDIPLPQLVVVGDQSSGKSSLLEGLTGLAFPIASDLCTRFATQIVLRRAPLEHSRVKVSIIPGPEAQGNETQRAYLAAFKHTAANSDFDVEHFSSILSDAAQRMGLPKPGTEDVDDLEKRFSNHVLKIELSGPDHPHLSVVDVPGLFHNPTRYQTREDSVIIRDLIESYITDRRTIIMAVMDGRNNLANQEVFRMARAADPTGSRTVGVVTKCDALQVGEEGSILRILQNEVENLRHGWFAVKNRSAKDIKNGVSVEERHANEEKFFKTDPWCELERNRVGIKPLKAFLGKLLYEHIREEFPTLVEEITAKLLESNAELAEFGPARQTPAEQRVYLTKLVNQYETAVDRALAGTYEPSSSSNDPLKLRMHIFNANERFAKGLKEEGYLMPFRAVDDTLDDEYNHEQYSTSEAEPIYTWIRNWYRESRGASLPGTVNPEVVKSLFRQQCIAWSTISENHLSTAAAIVRNFTTALYEKTIEDETIFPRILSKVSPMIESSISAAEQQLSTILADELASTLQTINSTFPIDLQATRLARIDARLRSKGLRDTPYNTSVYSTVKGVAEFAHLSIEDQAVYEIHDLLKCYYSIAIKRFADNVVNQVVERHLLGRESPVKCFCSEQVSALSDVELAGLVADDYETSARRTEVNYKIQRLGKALEIARKANM
ncbi:P-loop containing nucleoside triphosphate hydrolase protein [Choiromyces venosus 120613-1]|uniref:P-loop containing nucleoside triphosphate hydrolase protein n=1 Tax=Choiromyces venosus 120613-1 TaxID=1336337 RepID=A0A3N4JIP0_9PEZI|nr:P-loop containing nucleoside triphosphate hydrolase protein [Choiromyces venosus 120613-1]